MLPASGLRLSFISLGLVTVICSSLAPSPSYSEGLSLQSISIRGRISEKTLLGEDPPEDFESYDVSATFELPWKSGPASNWNWDTSLMASAGHLRGAGKDALIVSLVPEVTWRSEGGSVVLDIGAGGAFFSRSRFGLQDFGGAFQIAITFGASVPLYNNLVIGYRFMHYSDAAVHGPDTTGADFHMLEFVHRY